MGITTSNLNTNLKVEYAIDKNVWLPFFRHFFFQKKMVRLIGNKQNFIIDSFNNLPKIIPTKSLLKFKGVVFIMDKCKTVCSTVLDISKKTD